MLRIENTINGFRVTDYANGPVVTRSILANAIGRYYALDRRTLSREEQEWAARHYRARCAEEDVQKDRSVSTRTASIDQEAP